jgi:glycosyltransferase involved in cell wall biosynthesis
VCKVRALGCNTRAVSVVADAGSTGKRAEEGVALDPHVLCIGGEDHALRIPFMLALQGQGFRVTAAGAGDPAPFTQAGLAHHPFRFGRFAHPRADLAALGSLSRLLRDLRPDLAQSFDTKPNLLLPLAARGARDPLVVRTINGMGWVYSSRSPAALALRPIYRAAHRVAARWAAATVFQNRQDKAFFERHRMVGRTASRLIPGSGIDIDGFERASAAGPSPDQLRQSLGLASSEVVVTVARLTRQKGIPTLLEAAALVHEKRPGVRFLLVGQRQGEGPFAVTQQEIERHAPYVMALGQRSDIPALLRLADIFAFPTEYREGVPRALLEAALAGLPIVTTSMPGCGDIVRDGWNGFLVPPRSPHRLATAILDLLEDRRTARTMGERGAAPVRKEFGLDVTVARYAAIYAELLERVPRAGPCRTVEDDAARRPDRHGEAGR